MLRKAKRLLLHSPLPADRQVPPGCLSTDWSPFRYAQVLSLSRLSSSPAPSPRLLARLPSPFPSSLPRKRRQHPRLHFSPFLSHYDSLDPSSSPSAPPDFLAFTAIASRLSRLFPESPLSAPSRDVGIFRTLSEVLSFSTPHWPCRTSAPPTAGSPPAHLPSTLPPPVSSAPGGMCSCSPSLHSTVFLGIRNGPGPHRNSLPTLLKLQCPRHWRKPGPPRCLKQTLLSVPLSGSCSPAAILGPRPSRSPLSPRAVTGSQTTSRNPLLPSNPPRSATSAPSCNNADTQLPAERFATGPAAVD